MKEIKEVTVHLVIIETIIIKNIVIKMMESSIVFIIHQMMKQIKLKLIVMKQSHITPQQKLHLK